MQKLKNMKVLTVTLAIGSGLLIYNFLPPLQASDMDVKREIASSIIYGDVKKFDEIISKYPDLNYADFRYKLNKNLAMFFNYQKTKADFVERLVKLGVDLNHIDDDGFTPLLSALNVEKPEIVQALVDAGADIHMKKNGSLSAVEFCHTVVKNFPNNASCALIFKHSKQ